MNSTRCSSQMHGGASVEEERRGEERRGEEKEKEEDRKRVN